MEMAQRYCPHCGDELPPGKAVCSQEAENLVARMKASGSKENWFLRHTKLVALGVLLVIGGLISSDQSARHDRDVYRGLYNNAQQILCSMNSAAAVQTYVESRPGLTTQANPCE